MNQSFHFVDYAASPDLPLTVVQSAYGVDRDEPEHTHDFHELVLVQSGQGFHRFMGERFMIGAGTICLVKPGQTHGYDNIDQLTLVSFMFQESVLNPLLHELNALPGFQLIFHVEPELSAKQRLSGNLRIPAKLLPDAVAYARTIQEELRQQPPGFRAAGMTAFWALLLLLARHCEPANDSRAYRHAGRIGRVLSYMEKNIGKELPLTVLAHEAGMSVGTFRRSFSEAMNLSPVNYLLQLRLRKAAVLLHASRRSVTEVAFAVGFNDSNYFSHQFRKFYGFSPIHYRRHHPQNPIAPGNVTT